jgi:hypothetical protein
MAPRPVPDELWRTVTQLYERGAMLGRISTGCIMTALGASVFRFLVLGPHSPWHDVIFSRFVLPLWITAAIIGLGSMAINAAALRRARRLMIEYHEQDPGGFW